jgi:3-oxoacyl-(acyl-carrier-protein) synthase
MRRIRDRHVEWAIAGGSEAKITPTEFALLCEFGMMTRRNDDAAGACRPFDRTRDGTVLGEGACFFILESEEHAARRGAEPLARIEGFGSSCDALRITDPDPSGAAAALAMRIALDEAGFERVDYVNAHGTGTILNDRAECAAIRSIVPRAVPPLSSTKAATGHMLAAAGAIEAAICVGALRSQVLPPNLNYCSRDRLCDLEPIAGGPLRSTVTRVLSNAFGFGGQNACLALQRC